MREHYQMLPGSGLLNKQLFKVSQRSDNVVSEVILPYVRRGGCTLMHLCKYVKCHCLSLVSQHELCALLQWHITYSCPQSAAFHTKPPITWSNVAVWCVQIMISALRRKCALQFITNPLHPLKRLFSGLESFWGRPCAPGGDVKLMIEQQSGSHFLPIGPAVSEVFGACHGWSC